MDRASFAHVKTVPRSRKSSSWEGIRKLLPMLRPHYGIASISVTSGILKHLGTILGAAIGAYIVGLAFTGATVEQLIPWFWGLAGTILAQTLGAWLEMWFSHNLAYRILAELRVQVYWALERLAPSYLFEKRSGDITATVMDDVEKTELFYAHTVAEAIIDVIVVLAALSVLALLHPLLAIILVPALASLAVVPVWLRQKAEEQGRDVRKEQGRVSAEAVDMVQGLREILVFGYEKTYLKRFQESYSTLIRTQIRYGRRAGLEDIAINLSMALGVVGVATLAAILTLRGQLPESLYAVAIVLSVSAFVPTLSFMRTFREFGLIAAATQRVFQLLERRALVEDPIEKTRLALPSPSQTSITPHVRFENVSFKYEPGSPSALSNVSFEVKPGETVALVGHSGAGKSTCVSLLMRFWDVDSGKISIGGLDIRSLPQKELRDLITLVPQDIYLFNESIRENIRIGKPKADEQEVEKAAREALIHEFIVNLPDGYDTVAGERGVQMSGGQRQRIAIARALLKDSPILVMDEAVSNLDAKNEQLLHQAINKLKRERTTLIIAHRLSTIRSADRIVVLADGRVAETGSHDELMALGGTYARLVASQKGGVLHE